MALDSAQFLASSCRKASERHSLIDLDMLTDDRRLTDNDPRAVIDKEILPDRRSGVNIDARNAVSIFRHHAGDHRHMKKFEFVSDTIYRDGK